MSVRTVIGVAVKAAIFAAIGATAMSCNTSDYCLNCAKDDAGIVFDAAPDATPDAFVESDGGICVPTNGGVEICDGKDNDCDGKVDEGNPGAGVACGSNVGTCTTGTTSCTGGQIVCSGVGPAPEICDGLDNNCDGTPDDGDPGGGASCGSAEGLCTDGVIHCVSGSLMCVGGVQATAEICNGADDDCDGRIDEDVPNNGSCGHAAVGACTPGVEKCVGGGFECVGGVNPTFETCNHIDDDCDTVVDNGYNVNTDPQNCGDCTYTDSSGTFHNNVCPANTDVAVVSCGPTSLEPAAPNGKCSIAACDPGFYDIDHKASTGCEYACTYKGPTEICNGSDDDCDGTADNGVVAPPGLCSQVGVCNGATPKCDGSDGWVCVYPAGVSTVASTDGTYRVIVPESTCDGLDNDCDGKTDESFTTLGNTCNDGGLGICEGFGKVVCNTTTTTKCNITTPGKTAVAETCNGLDDNCNGFVDEGAATGNLPGQDWVVLNGTTQIMQYEAARPDATSTAVGLDQTYACSQPGVLPWTNVTYPQAVAACTAIGARICTEAEWQNACEQLPAPTYPIAGPTGATDKVYIEAENAYANATAVTGGTTYSWLAQTTQTDGSQCSNGAACTTNGNCGGGTTGICIPGIRPSPSAITGYSGTSYMYASPDVPPVYTNTPISNTAAQAPAGSPRLDFLFNVSQTNVFYYVWVRMYAPASVATKNGTHTETDTNNVVWVGINATTPPPTAVNQALTPNSTNEWQWVVGPGIKVMTNTAPWYVSVWMGTNGVAVDAIALSLDNTTPPTQTQDVWAYATNPKVSAPTTCNINSSTDTIDVTGSLASCYANGPLPSLVLGEKTVDITTVIQSKGLVASPSIVIVGNATVAKAGTLSEAGGVATFTLRDGISQVSDFETLLASSTYLQLVAHATPTTALFHTAGDALAATVLPASHAFDMSGNVKEWALTRGNDANGNAENPLRGGAADNDEEGATCNLSFAIADNNFEFPNVGFRCCR